ncbi:MAG TPA: L,D-transpeptidase [Polyangia bacterium]|nr:L,D-transpeptidase [Polyangia bacterium]
MLERDPRHPAKRRSRAGRLPGTAASALALAGLLGGNGQTTWAKQPPAASPPAPVAGGAAPEGAIMIVEGGHSAGQTTPDNARRDGLTVVDLSDDWLPYVFSEEPGKPQPLRPYLIDLANGRFRSGSQYARARADRFFEPFGIFPSLNSLRRRLADKKRHACHERVKDGVLEELSAKNVIPAEEAEKIPNPDPATAKETPLVTTGRTISPRPLTAQEKRAVIAMQAHLRCEDLLPGKAVPGRMDRRTSEGLKIYQHLQMLADNANIDFETRAALLGDSREQDFRALLRALRARVVDVTGLIEDGSALGVQGQVQGRVIDTNEFLPLSAPPGAAKPNPTPATATPSNPPATAAGPTAAAGPPAAADAPAKGAADASAKGAADASAKIVPAPDLIAAATQAASQALGWTSPEAVLASTLIAPPPASKRKAAKPKGPAPLPTAVAIRLPPPPPYHSPNMELRAEIDRGEVVLARPQLDKEGHKKWKPPVADRPTITLFAHVGDHDVALCRWPTTIGGWKMFQKSDGTMALKYKESVTGDALWTEVLATPTWHPAPGMPTSHLLIKVGDTFVPKTEIIGPGYHAAYGLVAMVHKQILSVNEKGEPDLMDLRIRTHGTPGYRTVKRGESNGCHRLHNYEALRLAAFLVKHHANTRDGLVPEDYVRKLQYKGQEVELLSESKGYRFKLTPPVPVKVLDGDVKGNAKSVKHMVPVAAVP